MYVHCYTEISVHPLSSQTLFVKFFKPKWWELLCPCPGSQHPEGSKRAPFFILFQDTHKFLYVMKARTTVWGRVTLELINLSIA